MDEWHPKICPFQERDFQNWVYCEENCALFTSGGCAFAVIAESLGKCCGTSRMDEGEEK